MEGSDPFFESWTLFFFDFLVFLFDFDGFDGFSFDDLQQEKENSFPQKFPLF